MARKATIAREQNRANERAGLVPRDAKTMRVEAQIRRIDKLMRECTKASDFPALAAAKERLWNLIYPKAGVLRPRQSKQSRPVPVATEAPAAPQPVVSCGVQPQPAPAATQPQSKPIIAKD